MSEKDDFRNGFLNDGMDGIYRWFEFIYKCVNLTRGSYAYNFIQLKIIYRLGSLS